jgi:hypothetical protein
MVNAVNSAPEPLRGWASKKKREPLPVLAGIAPGVHLVEDEFGVFGRADGERRAFVFGLLVVSVQKWALSTGKTVIERTVRQCSRETAFLKRQREYDPIR